MKKTYLFYDIETTGVHPCFDQVLQFAAIRTDLGLNELERYEYHVQLKPDVIPSPRAAITHLIPFDKIKPRAKDAEYEYNAIKKVHELFNTPGTTSLGYNTLGFDDEFLRFGFYRNLFDPYSHQYADGCSRMDLYPLAALYYLYCPQVLQWPKIDGQVSLKLEHLSESNQLAQGQAHDAMVDVMATLALAKKFTREGKVWQYAVQYFDKKIDKNRISQLPRLYNGRGEEGLIGLMLSGKIGKAACFQAPVLLLGEHKFYKNQTVWLRLDQENLIETLNQPFDFSKVEQQGSGLWVTNKKYGEGPFILPPTEKRLRLLTEQNYQRYLQLQDWLLKPENQAKLEPVIEYYLNYRYPEHDNVDPIAALYQAGFFQYNEKNWMRDFHRGVNIQTAPSARLTQLSQRCLANNGRIDDLNPDQIQEFNDYIQACWQRGSVANRVDYKGKPCLTVDQALSEIESLQQGDEIKLTEVQLKQLSDLKSYYLSRIE